MHIYDICDQVNIVPMHLFCACTEENNIIIIQILKHRDLYSSMHVHDHHATYQVHV